METSLGETTGGMVWGRNVPDSYPNPLTTGAEAIRTTVVPISGVIRTTVVPISGVIGPTVVRIANTTGIGYRHDGSIRFSNKLTYYSIINSSLNKLITC